MTTGIKAPQHEREREITTKKKKPFPPKLHGSNTIVLCHGPNPQKVHLVCEREGWIEEKETA